MILKRGLLVACALAALMLAAMPSFGAPPDYTFPGGNRGPVKFSHQTHSAKAGLKCTDCHPKIFAMKKGGGEKFTMAAIKAGKGCGACHNGSSGFPVTECDKCHHK